MNKIRFSIVALMAGMLFASCDMDQPVYSEVAAGDYVTDADGVNTLVIGAYSSLHDVMYNEWALTEVRSDNARCYDAKSASDNSKLEQQFDQSTVQSENAWMSSYWNACYTTIERSNNVLEYLGFVEDPALRNQYEGEAKFLRALEHFNLVRLWGPVFLVNKKLNAEESRRMQRTSVEDVYASIEADLEDIITNEKLPAQYAEADLGRASLNAAKALLAKVYATHYKLGDAQYQRAADLCREVLQSEQTGNPQSAADLVPYDRIFSPDNEMSKEIIFAVRYKAGNMGLGAPFGNLFAPLNNGGNVIIGRSQNLNTPSNDIINAYPAGDVRLDVNIAQRYYNSTTGNWVETGNSCRYIKKFVLPVSVEMDGESDWPVLRVGDVALLYAELSNELNGPSADALKYLNMVHERAGNAAFNAADLSSKYDFRMAVRTERRLELAFENQRWFDLLRWNTAVQTVNKYFRSEVFYNNYAYTVQDIAEWQTLLPIPVSVLNINSEIAQNPNY